MPRFFDDYSNTYLTHDSAAGRKQQRRGWKFRENFKLHYENHVQDWRKGGMGLASAQQAYIRAKGREDPMIPPLLDGWKEELDEATGITFYSHDESGERSWVRPQFVPPPTGPPAGRGGPGFRGPRGPPPMRQPPPMGMGPGGMAPPPQQMRGGPPGQGFAPQPPMRGQAPPPPPNQWGRGPPPPPHLQSGPPPQYPPPPSATGPPGFGR